MSVKKNVLLEFSMVPLDKGESLSQYVAGSLDIIDQSGLDYKLNPMGTVLEGSWEEVLTVVHQCFEKMKTDCNRITINMKVDYRKGKSQRLNGKIKAVEQHLGKELKQ